MSPLRHVVGTSGALILLGASTPWLGGCQPAASPAKEAPDHVGDSVMTTQDSPADSPLPDDTSRADSVPHDSASSGPPQVVLFIGDGMGIESVAGAGDFANGTAGTLGLEALPYRGDLRTASLSGITDSAASGTVMATGTKTYNGHLGLDRDLNTVENLVEVAKSLGMGTGMVTTDRLSGATPASFVVHTEDRYSYADVSAGYYAALPDVSLGGGTDDFAGLVDTAAVDVVETATDLAAWTPAGRPLLGIFSPSTFPYVYDTYTTQPTLAEMTVKAIDALKENPNGFFLMVEGARIDHAEHANDATRVFPETVAFDEAITAGLGELSPDATVLVTADHECGGLHIVTNNGVGVTPAVDWRYNWHTNADVGIWGRGPLADTFDGQRLDNAWVHAVLQAAIQQTAVVAPTEVPLVDGYLADLPAAAVTQSWDSSFGTDYDRMDALHVGSDADGLRIGVDGVWEDDASAIFVYVDIDYGDGTGWPHDGALTDTVGFGDAALSNAKLTFADQTFGAERALISMQAEEAFRGLTGTDNAGLRDITAGSDFGWLESATNFDSGNESLFNAPAPDAGVADEGFEAQIPWASLYGTDTPGVERRLAVVAVLVNDTGTYVSNQALPPFPSATEAGAGSAELPGEVAFTVDADGALVGDPVTVP